WKSDSRFGSKQADHVRDDGAIGSGDVPEPVRRSRSGVDRGEAHRFNSGAPGAVPAESSAGVEGGGETGEPVGWYNAETEEAYRLALRTALFTEAERTGSAAWAHNG